jgi:nucleoside-diphosphate-sugar epimerase
MQVLIIGGTAFMGPYVARHLRQLGHEVTLFHRGQTKFDLPEGVDEIFGDRHSLEAYAGQLRQLAPDVVLDMIQVTESNAKALMSVFRGFTRRVVVASSADVYRAYNRLRNVEPGPPDPTPLTENSPLREKFYPYRGERPREENDAQRWMDAYDKILIERVIMGEPELPGTILRLPAVYGPGDRQHRLFSYLKRMDDGRATILLQEDFAQWRFGYGYVEDVAQAITLAVIDDRASGRIYNVAAPHKWTQADLVRLVGEATGWNGRIVTAAAEQLPEQLQAGDYNWGQHMFMESRRIREELGFAEVVATAESLRRTVTWERANPPEPIDGQQFDYAAEDAVLAQLDGEPTIYDS